MAYELTDEQRAARAAVSFSAGEGFDLDGGHFLANWRRTDKELDYAEINVLVHGGVKFREVYRHRLPNQIELDEKEGRDGKMMPARRMLSSRNFACIETLKWHKHLVMRKALMSEPTCPIERLIEHVKVHPELIDKELFVFGEGCTDKHGKEEKTIILTGYDIFNRAANWREDYNLMAKSQHYGVVIPLSGTKGRAAWETAEDDFAPKINVGTWGLFAKFDAEINRAIAKYGQDIADPRWAPAVYQIVFDQSPKGGKKPQPGDQYSVHFVDPSTYAVPERAQEIASTDLSPDFIATLDGIRKPGTPRDFFEALQVGLVADLDLAKIMGYVPSEEDGDVFDQEATKRRPARAKSAPAKPEKSRPVSAKPEKKRTARRVAEESAVASEVEPCPKCGTNWPEDQYHCPGRDGPKKCRMVNPDLPKPTEDASAESFDELPFS